MRKSPGNFIVMLVAALLCGCAFSPHMAKRTTPQALAPLAHWDELDQTCYMGSDSKYHYFYRAALFSDASYKIPVAELPLSHPLPLRRKPYDYAASREALSKLHQKSTQ